jgi:hypothetical protein
MAVRQSCVTVRRSHLFEGPQTKRGTKLVGDTQPPLEYLVASSQSSLEGYWLSRVAKLAELRQAIHKLVNEWVQIQGDERTARWILKYRSTDASRSATSPPRALSTLDSRASLFLPFAEKDGECSPRVEYLPQQSLRRHSRVSGARERRSKRVGSAEVSRLKGLHRNFLTRSVGATDAPTLVHKRNSLDARPTKSSSDLPLALPPDLLAHDAAGTARNVATRSQRNICPEMRRCNSSVCTIVAAHFRRPPLSQFVSVSLGELRLASQQNRQSRSHRTVDSRLEGKVALLCAAKGV